MKLVAQDSTLDFSHPHVMGILNVTPDSSSDGGVHNSLIEAAKHANPMIDVGTTIIDIGGESMRPGVAEVSVEEELAWMILVAEAIAQRFEMRISVDTSKPEVTRESARAGAHIINDTRSLTELGALQAAAETGLPVCLMHIQGQSKTMQEAPRYEDVLADVECFFAEHTVRCEQAGIAKEKLLLDLGFGSGKSLSHNYQPLARLDEFHYFGLSLLVGMSRRSMIGQLLNVRPSERLDGSLACTVIVAMQGAQITHIHNVKETVEALRVVEVALAVKGKERYE